MIISKREKVAIRKADFSSDFLKDFLEKEKKSTTPPPTDAEINVDEAEIQSKKPEPAEENDLESIIEVLDSRYAHLGPEFISDEILGMLTSKNYKQYTGIIRRVEDARIAIQDAPSTIAWAQKQIPKFKKDIVDLEAMLRNPPPKEKDEEEEHYRNRIESIRDGIVTRRENIEQATETARKAQEEVAEASGVIEKAKRDLATWKSQAATK